MLSKIIKPFGIILLGFMLFGSSPFVSQAYWAHATTDSATDITPTNATFNGFVDTGGLPGDAWFEYGTSISFGLSTSLNAHIFNSAYSGNYSTNISGLTANTIYYFRSVAQNSEGIVYGNVTSFTTNFSTSGYNNSMSPTAVTTSGAVLADNTAQFNALILTGNSQKADTYFEWGTTPSLGNQTTLTPTNGAPAIRHMNTITGLAPGTAYYFRAVAQNSYGRSDGAILSLVTSGSAQNNTKTTADKITSTDTTTVVNKSGNETSASSKLGPNFIGSGSFFPTSLFGWLILLILTLALILLGKHAYRQFKK